MHASQLLQITLEFGYQFAKQLCARVHVLRVAHEDGPGRIYRGQGRADVLLGLGNDARRLPCVGNGIIQYRGPRPNSDAATSGNVFKRGISI